MSHTVHKGKISMIKNSIQGISLTDFMQSIQEYSTVIDISDSSPSIEKCF